MPGIGSSRESKLVTEVRCIVMPEAAIARICLPYGLLRSWAKKRGFPRSIGPDAGPGERRECAIRPDQLLYLRARVVAQLLKGDLTNDLVAQVAPCHSGPYQ